MDLLHSNPVARKLGRGRWLFLSFCWWSQNFTLFLQEFECVFLGQPRTTGLCLPSALCCASQSHTPWASSQPYVGMKPIPSHLLVSFMENPGMGAVRQTRCISTGLLIGVAGSQGVLHPPSSQPWTQHLKLKCAGDDLQCTGVGTEWQLLCALVIWNLSLAGGTLIPASWTSYVFNIGYILEHIWNPLSCCKTRLFVVPLLLRKPPGQEREFPSCTFYNFLTTRIVKNNISFMIRLLGYGVCSTRSWSLPGELYGDPRATAGLGESRWELLELVLLSRVTC